MTNPAAGTVSGSAALEEEISDVRLYRLENGFLKEATYEALRVAESYPDWPGKGPINGGRRITVMTPKELYKPAEPIDVVHVMETVEQGLESYVMGPKRVYGEHMDGELMTGRPPDAEFPWRPPFYDGAVVTRPHIDFGYEVTRYRLDRPGVHTIQWILDPLQSNVLRIEVTEDAHAK